VTGIVPFLPIYAALEVLGELNSVEFLFDYSHTDDITRGGHFGPLPRITVCVSRDPVTEGLFHEKVIEVLSGLKFDLATTDFYLCGVPAIMGSCRTILANAV
jgi:all-trans-retinol 13,14-reductase